MRGVLALALVALSAACAAASDGAPGLKLGITDSGNAYFSPPASFYPDLGRLHAKVLRVHLNWGGRLGVATRRPVDGADPGDRPTTGAATTRSSSRAADENVQVLFTIFGSPAWANGGQLPTRAPHRAADLVDFSFAAAQRYGGEFMRDDGTVLPRVRYWTALERAQPDDRPRAAVEARRQALGDPERDRLRTHLQRRRRRRARHADPRRADRLRRHRSARQQRGDERTADDVADRVPPGDEARRRRPASTPTRTIRIRAARRRRRRRVHQAARRSRSATSTRSSPR